MPKIFLLMLCTAAILLPGCKKQDSAPTAGSAPVAKEEKVSQQPQKSKAPSLDEAKAFLKKWGELQSNKDVSGYLSLYASDFTGIKRTTNGSTTTYNFQKWADDRNKMYSKATVVSVIADEIKLTGSDEGAGTAIIEFMQYYSSPKYCDKGRKTITLKRDGNDLKIVREELLFSLKTSNETVKSLSTTVINIAGYSESGDSLVFQTQHGEFYIYTAGGNENMDKAELLDKSLKNKTPVRIFAEKGLVSDVM